VCGSSHGDLHFIITGRRADDVATTSCARRLPLVCFQWDSNMGVAECSGGLVGGMRALYQARNEI